MRMQHPLTRLQYERQDDGCVRVSDKNGREGIFDKEGRWIKGDRKQADPAMCMWIATR